jgi:hypothetical protein
MAFDSSWLQDVPDPPSLDAIQPGLREVVASSRIQLDESGLTELVPGYIWSLLVGQENAQLAAISSAYPFVNRISFGFVEPDIDFAHADGPGLGVVVHISPPIDPYAHTDLEPFLSYPAFFDRREIFISNAPTPTAFPVVPRVSIEEPQVALNYPSTAMLTAWMKIRRSTAPKEGWLLPWHALGPGGGLRVTYTDGSSGTVIDGVGHCMDAVVASSPNRPSPTQACSAEHVLPPGLSVSVTDQHGTVFTQTLVEVDANIGLLGYDKAPIRLTYDWSSSNRGDSGALVSHGQTGAPVAMHQGTSWIRDRYGKQLRDNTNQPVRRAFGICLYQVAHQLDGEFYL